MKKIVHIWDQCGYVREVSKFEVPGFEVECFWKYTDFGYISKIVRLSDEFDHKINSRVRSPRAIQVSSSINLNLRYFETQTRFIQNLSKSNCYFEIHDLQLIERFPQLVERFIVHAHGSGVRSIGLHGSVTDTTSEITRFGLQNSPLVLYSTPEMGEIIKKYSTNSKWIPHPISFDLNRGARSLLPKRNEIFFPNSWDIGKGALEVLKKLSEKKSNGELGKYKLIGIDSGEFKNEARELGINLLKLSSHGRHMKRIKSSIGVVTQGYGILGVSDLEALKLNENVFLFLSDKSWLKAYDIDELIRGNSLNDFLAQPNKTNFSLRNQILRKHSETNVKSEIITAYNSLS